MKIADLDLDNGWHGEAESYGSSPIVAVRVQRGERHAEFRVDLGKRMFLDPAPPELAAIDVAQVVASALRRVVAA